MPIGTSYLANSADTVASYTDSYVSFTTDLITNTFEALLQAHHSQVEAYAELVSTLSRGLSTYINETVNDVQIAEVLDFINVLPLQQAGFLEEGQTIVYSEPTDGNDNSPLLSITENGNGGNVDFSTNIANKIFNPGDVSTGIGEIITNIKTLLEKPKEVETRLIENPYAKFFQSGANARTKDEAFMDIVRTVIAFNKYGLLENMVETGLLRMIMDAGSCIVEFDMELTESYSDKKLSSFRQRTKELEKNRSGVRPGLITSLFHKRNLQRGVKKRKVLTVSKRKRTTSSNTSGSAQMKAKVEIHFSTDYKPLLLNND